MLDLARESTLNREDLFRLAELTRASGYNGLGLYLEHNFVYPSASWAAGNSAIDAAVIRDLVEAFPDLQFIPFINLLGHVEGFLYTEHPPFEGDDPLAEDEWGELPFAGLQGCPSSPGFATFCKGILKDIIEIFPSPIIHIGGDETADLGKCPRCQARISALTNTDSNGDGGASPAGEDASRLNAAKAKIYQDWFNPLLEEVRKAGRRPAIWGDMVLHHLDDLTELDRNILVFDWHYHEEFSPSAKRLLEAGFEVVVCPTLHTYNAPWCHLRQSSENISDARFVQSQKPGVGFCLTTWEFGLFGAFEAHLPLIAASGGMVAPTVADFRRAFGGEDLQAWARLIGEELPDLGGIFGYSGIRSALKCRFLLVQNPFLLWLRHRAFANPSLNQERTERAKLMCSQAKQAAPIPPYRWVAEWIEFALLFVDAVDEAADAYHAGRIGECTHILASQRPHFEQLYFIAQAFEQRFGGSAADRYRVKDAAAHLDRVVSRVHEFGGGKLGYRPSFATLIHPNFTPYDQGNWWLINRWVRE